MKSLMLGVVIAGVVLIGLFIGLMAFTWRSDVSQQEPYIYFLNTPLTIKQPCAIIKSESRFKEFSLSEYTPDENNENSFLKKIYEIGDEIEFHTAKSFYSIHVGTSFYLIGNTTLPNGETVEFEYYWSNHSPRVWETLDEFLKRKEQEH